MGFPFQDRPLRQYYSAFEGAVADETSGMSIEAPEGGRGLLVHTYDATAGSRGGCTVHPSSAPILDTNVSVITPAILSNYDPAAAPAAIVREGRSGAGVTPTRPDWIIFFGRGAVLSGAGSGTIYVPPGFTLTFLDNAVNVTFNASIGLDEL